MVNPKTGFASSRIEALNEGIKAYNTLMAERSQSMEKVLSVKKMFFSVNDLRVNEFPSQLVNFFKEAARVWRQRAVMPPVRTGKNLVARAYDLII